MITASPGAYNACAWGKDDREKLAICSVFLVIHRHLHSVDIEWYRTRHASPCCGFRPGQQFADDGVVGEGNARLLLYTDRAAIQGRLRLSQPPSLGADHPP